MGAYDAVGITFRYQPPLSPAGIQPSHVRRSFDLIEAREAVPGITVHRMRHGHAVRLLKAGTPVNVVLERLRHKDVTTTRNVSASALPDMQDHAIDILLNLLGAAAQWSRAG